MAGRLTSTRAWLAAAALGPVLLYARTVGFGWAFDDQMAIVRNTYVHSLDRVADILRTTEWAGSGMESYLYRPLTVLTYAVNHAVSGLEPWSYHLVNVLLFAGTVLLVFRLGTQWRLGAIAAGVGALVFAVHPVHVEVVANVSGRKDLLTTAFVIGMALAHRRALAAGGVRLLLPVTLYAGAVLSKEVGVMGLFLVAAQDAFLEPRCDAFVKRPRVVGLYAAYAGVLAVYGLLHVGVTGALGVPGTYVYDNPLVDAGTASRLATALVVVGKGAALLVWPVGLSPDYSYDAIPVVRSVADWRFLAALVVLGLSVWSLIRARRTVLPLAVAWYALGLLPASNILVTTGTIFGERLLYLPSVAFCLAAGAAVGWMAGRGIGRTATAGAVLVVAASVQTVRYSAAWSDDIALFEWATRTVPRSTKAHHKLGEEYLRAGRLGDALRSLNRAVEIAPENPFATATRARARRTVVERFGGVPAPQSEVQDPDVLYVLGQSAIARGDSARAVGLWEAVLAIAPDHAGSLADLGASRLHARDALGAVEYLERAVAADPQLASAWYNLATVRLAQERRAEGIEALRRFITTAGSRYPEQVMRARASLRRLGVAEPAIP